MPVILDLPVIICIQSKVNNKYLRYDNSNIIPDPTNGRGLLKYSGECPLDPLARFEVVPARSEGGLIHLKSCFTDKYLARSAESDYTITPVADNPNENQSEWSCTLFQPEHKFGAIGISNRLLHVQLRWYAVYYHIVQPILHDHLTSSLYLRPISFDFHYHRPDDDAIIISDGSAVQTLPKDIVFKGDNDKYLGVFSFNDKPYLRFSFENPTDPEVAHDVLDRGNGTVCIRSKYHDKIWRVDEDGMIMADVSGHTSNDVGVMFRPNFINKDIVALLSVSKKLYCKRYTSQYGDNLLSASDESADGLAKLHYVEPWIII